MNRSDMNGSDVSPSNINRPETMHTVREVAEMAGVSVRTLHHYDAIGLLNPAGRSAAGYRLYGRQELRRLQQILLFREMEVPLDDIKRLLTNPAYDEIAALKNHRRALRARATRLATLIETVEKTIAEAEGERQMLTDDQLYAGLPRRTAEKYQSEAQERWPEEYTQVDQRVRTMDKDRWERVQREGTTIAEQLAANIAKSPASATVQRIVAHHHTWIGNFYHADAARYRNLAEMYVTDERFTAYYDRFAPGLAALLAAGMDHFAETQLE